MKAIHYTDWKEDAIPLIMQEIWVQKIYQSYFKQGSVVLDIGANIGLFTHYASFFANKIYAIEPSKRHFDLLLKNIEVNEWKNIVPIKCAVSNYNGKTKLYHSINATMYSLNESVKSVHDDLNKPKGHEEVEVKTLKKLFEEYKIDHVDFAKIDVEGEEMKIMSSKEFKEVSKKIDALVVEWHEWTNISISLLVASLRDCGYMVRKLPVDATVLEAKRT